MKQNKNILSILKLTHLFAFAFGVFCMGIANAATVAQRPTNNTATTAPASRPTTASRVNMTSRLPTSSVNLTGPVTTTVVDPIVEETAPVIPDPIVIENKSSQFDTILGNVSSTSTDLAAQARADTIRSQRAALDAAGNIETTTQRIENAVTSGANSCDTALRTCMRGKCGNDFSKCSGDGDTIWGDKMSACRRDTNCSGAEYALFSREIKADRDHNAKMTTYTTVIECGAQYNSCITDQCGLDFQKCINKKRADTAIANCAAIARDCQTFEPALTSRIGTVFGTIRTNASVQISADEKKLLAMRDSMKTQCNRLGAMFDERTLDCVFTVNFFSRDASTPMASKKLYAGSTFDCNQDFFGIDITTYRENAYRLTREQQSASSGFMGAGLGVAAGAISSGAINRALDTNRAENAADSAACETGGGKWNKFLTRCSCGKGKKWDKAARNCRDKKPGESEDPEDGVDIAEDESDQEPNDSDIDNDPNLTPEEKTTKKQQRKDERAAKKSECEASGGTWQSLLGKCKTAEDKQAQEDKKAERQENREARQEERAEKKAERQNSSSSDTTASLMEPANTMLALVDTKKNFRMIQHTKFIC